MKLNELNEKEKTHVLVYGDSGTGKTVFATSFPTPIYVADFDLKVSSAANYYRGTDRIDKIEYDSYTPDDSRPGGSYDEFIKRLGEIRKDCTYGTVVLDSLTTFSDECAKSVMRRNPGIKRAIPGVPALQDYGIIRVELKRVIMSLLSLPCNIVCTAHIDIKKDELTGELLRLPMLTGKLAQELPIYFKEVYRSYTEGKDGVIKYLAQTQSDRKFSCRSQIGGLPNPMDLTYESINRALSPQQEETKQ